MDIDYNITTSSQQQQPDPVGPDEDVVWELEFTSENNSFTGYFTDPRAAIDRLALVMSNRLGEAWDQTKSTEHLLRHFSGPAGTDTFRLNRHHVDHSRGGGWPANGERILPIAPGRFQCICDPFVIDMPFVASTSDGTVPAAPAAGHVLHLGCGRVVSTATALVVARLPVCDNCGIPVRFSGQQWMHLAEAPKQAFLYCYGSVDSGMAATPAAAEDHIRAGRRRPMPGDAVLLVAGFAGAPAGEIGVIDGMVGEVTGWSSITFSLGGFPRVYRDDMVVRCSGGPGTITADLSELQPTDSTQVLKVWRFHGGRRRAGNDEEYEVRVPVWTWDPSRNA